MEIPFAPDFKMFSIVHCHSRLEAAILLKTAAEHGYTTVDDTFAFWGASYSLFQDKSCYEFRERNDKKAVILKSLGYYESHCAEVSTFPEFILSTPQNELIKYGYNTTGMYATHADNAKILFQNSLYPVFLLNEDGTSTEIFDVKDIVPRKLYGIKQDDFNQYMKGLLTDRTEEREPER